MKKLLSVLLAIMMLVLPLSGLAEGSRTSVTFEADSAMITALAGDTWGPAVSDILNILGLNIASDDSGASLALTLNGSDAVTFQAKAEGDRLYVAGNLFGNSTISCSAEEAKTILARLYCAADDTVTMDQALETAGSLIDGFTSGQAAASDVLSGSGLQFDVDGVEDLADSIISGFDTEKVQALAERFLSVLSTAEISEYSGSECPDAKYAMTVTMTADELSGELNDLKEIVSGNTALTSIADQILAQIGSDASLNSILDSILPSFSDLTISLYSADESFSNVAGFKAQTSADGSSTAWVLIPYEVVGGQGYTFSVLSNDSETLHMTAETAEDSLGTHADMDVTSGTGEFIFSSTIDESAETADISFEFKDSNEDVFTGSVRYDTTSFNFVLNFGDASVSFDSSVEGDAVTAALTLTSGSNSVVLSMNTAGDALTLSAGLNGIDLLTIAIVQNAAGNGCDASAAIAGSTVLTAHVVTEAVDSLELSAINMSGAVTPGTMTDSEWSDFVSSESGSLTGVFTTVMMQLPESFWTAIGSET